MDLEKFETVAETAVRRNVSRQTVYEWLRNKEIAGGRDPETHHWQVERGAVPLPTATRREVSDEMVEAIEKCL